MCYISLIDTVMLPVTVGLMNGSGVAISACFFESVCSVLCVEMALCIDGYTKLGIRNQARQEVWDVQFTAQDVLRTKLVSQIGFRA